MFQRNSSEELKASLLDIEKTLNHKGVISYKYLMVVRSQLDKIRLLNLDSSEKTLFDFLNEKINHMLSYFDVRNSNKTVLGPSKDIFDFKTLSIPNKKNFNEYYVSDDILKIILSLLFDHERIPLRSVSQRFNEIINNIPIRETFFYVRELKCLLSTRYYDSEEKEIHHTYQSFLDFLKLQPMEKQNEIAIELSEQVEDEIKQDSPYTAVNRYSSLIRGAMLGFILGIFPIIIFIMFNSDGNGKINNSTSLGELAGEGIAIEFTSILFISFLSMAIDEIRLYCAHQLTRNKVKNLFFFSNEGDRKLFPLEENQIELDGFNEKYPVNESGYPSDSEDEFLDKIRLG